MLLSWSTMAAETDDSLGNMSTAEMLRGIISEKLTTAAQEILAVVERTVAGYEEEASGFRQEIDRQRRQLEVLMQPQVKLETTDDHQLFPVCEPVPEEAAGGGELHEEEEQYKYEPSVEDGGSLGLLLCYTEDQTEEEREARSSTPDQEHLTPLDYDTASRSVSPIVQSDRRSAGRRRISEPQDHVDLRIRILEDSQISVLSNNVFQKYPLQELQCPLGLQESDFLDLLRSTFPQLAADQPFDIFTTDHSRKLQPLRVATLTPEKIYNRIRSTGYSALYIRLKEQEEPPVGDKELRPLQTEDADPPSDSITITTNDKTTLYTRLSSPTVRSDRKKRGRRRTSEPQDHVDLRICILEDSEISVLSTNVFRKYPLQELQCPLGLDESDFLDLLRSSFPQLAADQPFDVFTTNHSRKLQPLRVDTLTPEEIYDRIRSTGYSALYIRLKTKHLTSVLQRLQSTDEELQPSQRDAADPQTGNTRLSSPRVQSDRRSAHRRRTSEPQNHVDLRIRILEDSQISVLSTNVFQKYPLQELRCPLGLQESDFLDLLRSTFPQLAARQPFDVFTCDRTKRLQPLTVKTLTPEEIDRTIRSIGAGTSALYIRLKTGSDPQSSSSSDLHHPPQREEDATDSPSSSMTTNQSNTYTRDLSERRRRGRPRLGEEPSHHYVRVCMLEDSQSQVLSKNVLLKSPVQDLKCPRGLQEADFLVLLRSAFPQLAGDDKPFNVFKSDRSRRLQRLRVKTLTPEEIYRAMKSTGVEKTVLYIRLKTGEEEEEEEEELHLSQRNDDAANESPKSDEADLHSSPVQPPEGSSSTSQQQDMKTEEADDEADVSDDDKDGDEDDWKPDPELQSLKTRKRRAKRCGMEGKLAEKSKTPCKVCGVWYRLLGSLIKHAWKHTDEPQCVCGVCGEQFESVDELKRHLQTYQKTHECSYCGKSFFTVTGLNCHTTLHTGNRPFKCDVCHKTFAHLSSLNIHRWVHVEDKPHKCDVCLKAFGLKAQLKAHMKVHTGRDKYHCHVCGKCVYDVRSLTRHKATHSGERRYGCEVCGKRFKLADTLKSHAKIHTVRDRPYLCHICCKTFLSNCGLTAHMRTHSDERPFVCIMCSKGFLSNGELKVHMRVHTGEAPYGCSECGRFFKRKTHLNNHVRTHLGIKLFVCSVCGKACSRQEHLTVHMRTHNGERPYKCSLCDKAFTQSHCLKTHMKSHQRDENLFLSESTS
ncbi:uncharacterized protein LOC122974068 isoform X1 [Thunnus albacares]|uniref:uncharacterized protein LOC122974068 isoform X1 n=1 Tax=Thunnus albacares TaxID=8236 RepID=UPI001CF710B1|nr:uncharacterized protein LOC122974068 isoform X1 [Thunnus albacares]